MSSADELAFLADDTWHLAFIGVWRTLACAFDCFEDKTHRIHPVFLAYGWTDNKLMYARDEGDPAPPSFQRKCRDANCKTAVTHLTLKSIFDIKGHFSFDSSPSRVR